MKSNFSFKETSQKLKDGEITLNEAKRSLIENFGKEWFAVANSILRNRQNAEDAAQNYSINIWVAKEETIQRILKSKAPRAFMGKFVKYRCIDHLRKRKRDESVKKELKEQAGLKRTSLFSANQFEAENLNQEIMDMMPIKQADVLILKSWNYSHKEIANLLGVSEDASRTRLKRAREFYQLALKTMEAELNFVRT